ncbi:MAG: nucleotidyltransferase domain-containing protein [Methanobrevibacter sp.]|jgi:predicted nucleotidyltransferase|nr:nucleotidyltransferase domain-containing protein [Candidatus Methanovirga meridionalis]
MKSVSDFIEKREVINRKQIAIDFANSLNHPEIEKIILFGSVARGEDNDESDIDILILTSKKCDKFKIDDDIYSKVMDVVCRKGEYIAAKIIPFEHYRKHSENSFYTNVFNEGIVLA